MNTAYEFYKCYTWYWKNIDAFNINKYKYNRGKIQREFKIIMNKYKSLNQ